MKMNASTCIYINYVYRRINTHEVLFNIVYLNRVLWEWHSCMINIMAHAQSHDSIWHQES